MTVPRLLAINGLVRIGAAGSGQLFAFLLAARLSSQIGVGALLVGVIGAAFFVTELVGAPFAGSLADRVGQRRILRWGPVFGVVSKPDIEYRFFDHARYIEGFIEALGLQSITLVVHDWGSGLGFHYASRHEDNTNLHGGDPADVELGRFPRGRPRHVQVVSHEGRRRGLADQQEYVCRERAARLRGAAADRRGDGPLPRALQGSGLAQAGLALAQRAADRGRAGRRWEAAEAYHEWLQRTELPKILFHATPGALMSATLVESLTSTLKNLKTVDIGPGVHFVQEDNPHEIGRELAKWYQGL